MKPVVNVAAHHASPAAGMIGRGRVVMETVRPDARETMPTNVHKWQRRQPGREAVDPSIGPTFPFGLMPRFNLLEMFAMTGGPATR